MIIVSEDIGLADRQAPALVNALYQMCVELYKHAKGQLRGPKKERVRWNEESLTQAVWYRANTTKNRELCDQYALVTQRMARGERLEVDDDYLDMHTQRGRAMGRSLDHFNEVADRLHPEVEIDGNRWGKAWEAERPQRTSGDR